MEEYKKGFVGVDSIPPPNARSGFSLANAREVFALHEEYSAIGKSIVDWNIGIWVVTRGTHKGVFYGKFDTVRAMGPLRYNPRVELASSEFHATALLDPSHRVHQLN